ncbi:Syntaxin [Tripterygium wilfordii]|uniref:Syntaxin n=1 Tax=Tripterygium wilfordii TaxID=458696 RepID=A0A7J7BX38_TRIWF|nr:Syntaxin [Tripterygium wilfordii]
MLVKCVFFFPDLPGHGSPGCCPRRDFRQHRKSGDKRCGSCSTGHGCSPHSKELAKEVEEMHDDSHYLTPGHRNHRRPLYFEALEEVINRVWDIQYQFTQKKNTL